MNWRNDLFCLLALLVIGLLAMSCSGIAGEEQPTAAHEEAAIRELVRRGAIVKRFNVMEAELSGQLVRFKAEHLLPKGTLEPELRKRLAQIPRAAVEFRGVPLTDTGLEDLVTHVRLIGLDVSGSKITDNGLECFGRLPEEFRDSLRLLDLSFTQVTDAGTKSLSNFRQLRHISLVASRVTDHAITTLSKLPELREAYVAKTQITESAVRQWRQQVPRCRIEQ